MLTEKQFRVAFRAHVDGEARAILVERPGVEYVSLLPPESPYRRTFLLPAAASFAFLAAVGAAAWIGLSNEPMPTTPATGSEAPTTTQGAAAPSAVEMATIDGSFGMFAGLVGTLQETEGCLSVGETLVVLDSKEWTWDSESGVLLHTLTGRSYQLGDEIELGGGWKSSAEFRELAELPARCADYEGDVFVD